ncbi:MAG: pseudouridine-5'-phosphate glycosidase [Chloroflexi bacterium]|nr:pseudouridine-5'-phosphate glycosidase [Chloroflexota bacterium]
MRVIHPSVTVLPEVKQALAQGGPVVALESAVITHGLPRPTNLELARGMEAQIREVGAIPATVAVLEGIIRIGLVDDELVRLAESDSPLKISQRDFATAIVRNWNGGTTVAGTMFAADLAGIKVFATGGIGGVHREIPFDLSNDLRALAEIPMLVVCAGAKFILDLPSTLEYLETAGVPVVGYQTGEFPAFYSRTSGLKLNTRSESPKEIADFMRAHWGLGLKTAMLVVHPVPEEDSISTSEIEPIRSQVSEEARQKGIHGPALTPFMLERIGDLTSGRSLRANLALLLNNARLAAQIAEEYTYLKKERHI